MMRKFDGIGTPIAPKMLCSASENPNSSAANTAPTGLHRPKIIAARAMKPLPEEMSCWNEMPVPIVR